MQFGITLLAVVSVLLCAMPSASAIKWLALHRVPSQQAWNHTRHCPRNKTERKKHGLVGYQSKLCRRYADLMPVIMRAARGTRYVCERQFAWYRWNCSSLAGAPELTPDLTKGTREQAFVYALAAAAVLHQTAKACVTGEIAYCPCGRTPRPAAVGPSEQPYKWKGCSDNVDYGAEVSKQWADAAWRPKRSASRSPASAARALKKDNSANSLSKSSRLLADESSVVSMRAFMRHSTARSPRVQMNQHNSEAGRQVARSTLRTKCKCHGVSNSCNLKTCWKVLPPLSVVSERLHQRYKRATEVRSTPTRATAITYTASGARLHDQPDAVGRRRGATRLHSLHDDADSRMSTAASVPADALVYVAKSPDYCSRDARVGSFGTFGRLCNATSTEHDGCSSMCCGRGARNVERTIERNCRCKYVHCCYVKCQTCRETIQEHYCN